MNASPDLLDELLKADARAHRDQYIDDDGFSLRLIDVLKTLPRPKRRSRRMRIGLACLPLALALVAALFTTLFAGGQNFLIDVTMDLATETITREVMAFGLMAVAFFAMMVATLVSE